MSIDHGKLLVACRRKLEAYRDAYGLEYVGGQELSSLLADIDRALARPAEAVESEVEQAELRRFQENNTAFVSGLYDKGILPIITPAPVALRYFASGPEGSFFTDDLALARGLVNKYDPDGDWTITDLQNPTGDT